MSEKLPDRIYLQVGEGFDGEATWCSERIDDSDVEYVRAAQPKAGTRASPSVAATDSESGSAVAPAVSAPALWARDIDGTGSLHMCAKDDPGAMPFFAESAAEDRRDAERWRELINHVGAHSYLGVQRFQIAGLDASHINLMQGSTAEHLTNLVDAAIDAERTGGK